MPNIPLKLDVSTEKNPGSNSRNYYYEFRKSLANSDNALGFTILDALEGEQAALEKMAEHYRQKKQFGRALIFTCLSGNEIEFLKIDLWKWFSRFGDKNKLIDLKGFLWLCVRQENLFNSYLPDIKKFYGPAVSDPIVLILFAFKRLLAEGILPLSVKNFEDFAAIQDRIEESFISTLKDLGLNELTEAGMKQIFREKVKVADDILASEKILLVASVSVLPQKIL